MTTTPRPPELNGLVLCGGRSTRMQTDKAKISYKNKPQVDVCFDLLSQLCERSFVSCRRDQDFDFPSIYDLYEGLGPLGGILSAFAFDPTRPWLVVACDLPLLDLETLQYLIKNRDSSKMATCFRAEEAMLPEPLCTIFEPQIHAQLLRFRRERIHCPRKILIKLGIEGMELPFARRLANANHPKEREAFEHEFENRHETH